MGSLMYVMIRTHPDIAYAMSTLCTFNMNPDSSHWSAAKHVLQYLKGTKDLGITYTKYDANNNQFYGYADASFTNNTN